MNQNQTPKNLPAKRVAPNRIAVTIRLPEDVVAKIDCELESRAVPMSRNNWLLEAAIEKLQRERRGGSHGTE